jgi:hypothetical protein
MRAEVWETESVPSGHVYVGHTMEFIAAAVPETTTMFLLGSGSEKDSRIKLQY